MANFIGKRKGIKETIYFGLDPKYNLPAINLLLESAINRCFNYFEKELSEQEDLIQTLLEEKKLWVKAKKDLESDIDDLKYEIKQNSGY